MKLHTKFIGGILSYLALVTIIFISGQVFTFAAPPFSPYIPGEILSPTCAPGSSNCTVRSYAVSGINNDITSLTALTTPISVTQGGSGLSTLTTNAIILGNGTSSFQMIAPGSQYQVLRMPQGGGSPSYGAIDLSQANAATGSLATVNGGTGLTSYLPGDLIFASATNTLSKLSVGTNGLVLTLTGGVPAWVTAPGVVYTAGNGITLATSTFSINESQINLGNVGGVLPPSKGGTGTSTIFTAGSLIFAGASGIFSQNNNALFWDNSINRLSVVGTIAGTHLKGLGSTPTIVAGTGAGTGGLTAPVVSVSGTDSSGEVTVTPGNGVLGVGSTVFTLTYASSYGQAPRVIFSPSNAATALLSGATNVYSTSAAGNFTFTSGTAALTALTSYKWTYQIIE